MPRLRALLIGLNYRGSSSELRGCINDINHMEEHIRASGYEVVDLKRMDDDSDFRSDLYPNRTNMIKQLKALIRDSRPGDRLLFHFSGHGGSTYDYSGDEADGKDETLYPLDMRQIIDDEIKVILDTLPVDRRLVGVIDACHSGSMFELNSRSAQPGVYAPMMQLKAPPVIRKKPVYDYLDEQQSRHVTESEKCYQCFHVTTQTHEGPGRALHGPITMFSGCQDHQTSADAWIDGEFRGAMTVGLEAVLAQVGGLKNFIETHLSTRAGREACERMLQQHVNARFSQIPMMSHESRNSTPVPQTTEVEQVAPPKPSWCCVL